MSLLLQSLLRGHAGVKNSDQWDFDFSDRTLCSPDGSFPGRYVHSGDICNIFVYTNIAGGKEYYSFDVAIRLQAKSSEGWTWLYDLATWQLYYYS
ncbi:hypothetical protein MUK42_37060 [Musa troglodytarum]|uniref:Uncharacterized protein n=1 Tax=Musa troglodytarum TaxID=320322 RepID=A0A9E7JRP7_9LILI|nr:hypothetical protein MUK42_37060 [Musa troglodytarum]